MERAAFFDFDRTLFRGNSGVIYSRWLFFRGRIPLPFLLKTAFHYLLYRLNMFDPLRFFNSSFSFVRGWRKSEVYREFADYFDRKVRPRLDRRMKRIIEEKRKEGYRIVIVTNSFYEIARNAGRALDAEVIASELEVKDGLYTGRMKTVCYGEKKAELVRAYALKHGIDLAGSYAYSDSYSDLPMLEAVGMPVAVRPDRMLRKHAEKESWPVIG